MKNKKFYPTLCVLLGMTISVAGQEKVAGLSWLAGCWEMKNEKKDLLITEMWMKPAGNGMLGIGRTVKSGKLVDFEFLRIIENDNVLSYISRPSGNNEDTAFKMIKSSANEIVFENSAHDFPQRIIYKRDSGKLLARIEGAENGKVRGVDFAYGRVKCD